MPQAVGGSLLYKVRNGTRGISIKIRPLRYHVKGPECGLALLLDKSITSTSKTAPHVFQALGGSSGISDPEGELNVSPARDSSVHQ